MGGPQNWKTTRVGPQMFSTKDRLRDSNGNGLTWDTEMIMTVTSSKKNIKIWSLLCNILTSQKIVHFPYRMVRMYIYIYIYIPTTLYNLKIVLDVSLLRSTIRPLRGYIGPCFQVSSPVGFSWISWAFLDFPSFKSPSRYEHLWYIYSWIFIDFPYIYDISHIFPI